MRKPKKAVQQVSLTRFPEKHMRVDGASTLETPISSVERPIPA